MANLKVLLKDRVLTCGSGERRVVLDYDSGLIYQYSNPANVVAVYGNGRWECPDRPYYSSGGWGRGSSGDWLGSGLQENARELLQAIDATAFEYNIPSLLSFEEYSKLDMMLEKAHKVRKEMREVGYNVDDDEFKVKTLKAEKLFSTKGAPGKGRDAFKMIEEMEKAAKVFVDQTKGAVKHGPYRATKSEIRNGETLVAFRDAKGDVFMNSQMLSVTEFERKFLGGQSIIQKAVRAVARYTIPFNVLSAAKLSLEKTVILENGPEEDFSLSSGDKRHFTGALLLGNGNRRFLMDVDRIEIGHGLFNAFFVEVKRGVSSIAEAYDSMKPDEVKAAERAGIEVRRQGEWFFVDAKQTLKVPKEDVKNWGPQEEDKNGVARYQVAHGKGRPNHLYRPFGYGELDTLVCGLVTHTGREHKPLDLGCTARDGSVNAAVLGGLDSDEEVTLRLWKIVPNTTIGNFTIEGDID